MNDNDNRDARALLADPSTPEAVRALLADMAALDLPGVSRPYRMTWAELAPLEAPPADSDAVIGASYQADNDETRQAVRTVLLYSLDQKLGDDWFGWTVLGFTDEPDEAGRTVRIYASPPSLPTAA